MSNVERQKLIENAIAHYRAAMVSGEPNELKAALNDMENVYYPAEARSQRNRCCLP